MSGPIDHISGSPGGRATNIMEPTTKALWENVNHKPFRFRHHLEGHPLLEISQLAKIAASAADKKNSDRFLNIANDGRLSKLPLKERLTETFLRIDSGSHWLKVSSLQELHPDYEYLLQSILAEMEDLTGVPLRRTITWAGLTLIASPNMITPYHFDHDTNFLFQIKGEKDVYLFDPNDRSVLSEEEIETFYRGYAMAGKYRDELIDKGHVFHLTAGAGVHQPPLAPHLVKNGDNLSISLSVYYTDPCLDARAKIYQANYLLRCGGLQPRPPGVDFSSDRFKTMAISAFSKSSPKTWDDLVYSGIKRICLPYRILNWIGKRVN